MTIKRALSTLTWSVVLLGACAGSSSPRGSASADIHPTPSPSASVAASAAPTPIEHFAGMFDIGGGREVFMECTGSGSPTVLFESGDTDDHGAWGRVVPGVVGSNRACTYDRLGTGQSDPATGCRKLDDIRGDFEALLAAAKVDPPFVLVGTSGGGYLIAGYALAHPEDVKGMVIVDTFPAIDLSEHPPELAYEISCENPANVEHRDYAAVEHAAWDNLRKIGDIPVTVITNDYTGYAENIDERESIERQKGWFALNPDGAKQVIVTTGHDVPGNEPGVIVDEITSILR